MKLRIEHANLLTLDPDQPFVADGCICVEGNTITYVGRGSEGNAEKIIDARGGILLPGFVNAHTHLPMALLRGAGEDLPLMKWLKERIFPLEDKLTGEAVYYGSLLNLMEMAKTGTTAVIDSYYFCPEIAQAVGDIGLRACLARSIQGQTLKDAKPRLEEAEDFYRTWQGAYGGRITVSQAIHAEYTTGVPVMEAVADLAKRTTGLLQVHVSETQGEHIECQMRHDGATPMAVLNRAGALENQVIAAHCTYVTPEDRELMAEKGVYPVTCPKSNLKLGSGIAPVVEMLEAGLPVALGTDGAASNNNQDMIEELKFMSLLQKGTRRAPEVIPVPQALKIACQHGARAAKWKSGVLQAGAPADLVLLDTSSTRYALPALTSGCFLYAAYGQDVRLTVVDGQIVYQDGNWPFIDGEEVQRKFTECQKKLWKKTEDCT